MKNSKLTARRFRKLYEAEQKPKLVQHLEAVYGDYLWKYTQKPFPCTDRDMHMLFDMINDGVFGNRLGRGVSKIVLEAKKIPSGPMKYRGLEGAMAAFAAGVVEGQAQELIMVSHDGMCTFFDVACSLMHEMIHMYDFEFGPMGRQLRKYGAIASYNFNYPAEIRGRQVWPRVPQEFALANIANAAAARFRSARQLPDEIGGKIAMQSAGVNPDPRPRQYQVPGVYIGSVETPDTHERIPQSAPLPMKFGMGEPDGFYDVHGAYFEGWAKKFNDMGFAVTDVMEPGTPHVMQKTYEAEGAAPFNPAEAALMALKADRKACEFKDPGNWAIEIS